MTRFMAVAGKGGVGKTTTSINLASALKNYGRNVVLVDGNIKSPNVALHLGASKVENTIHDVLLGSKKIRDSAYMHISGLRVIPGSLSTEKQDAVSSENLKNSIIELIGAGEVVIIDTGNDSSDLKHVLRAADELLVVTTPDLPAVTEAMKTIKKAKAIGLTVIGAVINRAKNLNSEMTMLNVQSMLNTPVLAVVSEDKSVGESLVMRHPVVYSHPDSKATEGFKLLARKLIGDR
jgi:septum site-determining protein MinD